MRVILFYFLLLPPCLFSQIALNLTLIDAETKATITGADIQIGHQFKPSTFRDTVLINLPLNALDDKVIISHFQYHFDTLKLSDYKYELLDNRLFITAYGKPVMPHVTISIPIAQSEKTTKDSLTLRVIPLKVVKNISLFSADNKLICSFLPPTQKSHFTATIPARQLQDGYFICDENYSEKYKFKKEDWPQISCIKNIPKYEITPNEKKLLRSYFEQIGKAEAITAQCDDKTDSLVAIIDSLENQICQLINGIDALACVKEMFPLPYVYADEIILPSIEAKFPGGMEEFKLYIERKTYQLKSKKSGSLTFELTIERDGSVSYEVLRFSEEKELIQTLGEILTDVKWIPAESSGHKIAYKLLTTIIIQHKE